MFAVIHIIAILSLGGFIIYKIFRLVMKWIKNVRFLLSRGARGRAVWLLCKGFLVIAAICVIIFYIEYIAMALVTAFVFFMHFNPRSTTILYTSDFLTVIQD